MKTEIHRVFLGLGSNIGGRKANCLQAVDKLKDTAGLSIIRQSSLYETSPWGVKTQPAFINMVIEAETTLAPEELLVRIKRIEREMGRERTIRWGPRLIDIDILLYDSRIINTTIKTESQEILQLIIPHPLMDKREFVLKPMAEIAPDVVHPSSGKTIAELLTDLNSQQGDL